jgi:hypothetical protein
MKLPCGCCEGVDIVTPEPLFNRPGLDALVYRVGTHAAFLDTMLARLSSLSIDVAAANDPTQLQRVFPLRDLTTRDPGDLSIALLDGWAVIADVLTFYQERIANEGFLRTAIERRSILELARLVGYRLRPGVSASVYLALTATDGFQGTIPTGTRAQSIPGTGERPQFFETSEDLAVRDAWNALKPRLARPQVITQNVDPGTDAATRDTLYFQGIATNLKVGDALLVVFGEDTDQQVVRFIDAVNPQADQGRTEVVLRPSPPNTSRDSPPTAYNQVHNTVAPFIDEASSIFAGNDLAASVADLLKNLLNRIGGLSAADSTDTDVLRPMVTGILPAIQEKLAVARERQFTRLAAWLSHLSYAIHVLANDVGDVEPLTNPPVLPVQLEPRLSPSPLANLTGILDQLARPPSLQPANSRRLVRSVAQVFAPQADTAPRLLAAFKPAVAGTLYQAWSGVATPSAQVRVYALRVKAAPYGHNAPRPAQVPPTNGTVTFPADPTLDTTDQGSLLSLDAVYDKITPNGWAVIDSPALPGAPSVRHIGSVDTISRAEYGMTARVTRIAVGSTWLPATPTFGNLRQTTVWAQSELLDLADEPIENDVEGDSVELASLYPGLESGRFVIVSGERTDIPHTTGVTASELVMIAGVAQGARAPLCALFPRDYIPFDKVYYTTDANRNGDRLLVGRIPDFEGLVAQKLQATFPNQQFCDQVQLAPGVHVNAYVPTGAELKGAFPDFDGLLVDPTTGVPFLRGQIPAAQTGPQLFAWRISTQPVHTILTLANALAYKYDSTSLTVNANVVKATHGQTVGEVLGDGDGSAALQRFTLGQRPLTYVAAPTPSGADSTLTVRINEVEWHEVDSLAGLGPRDRRFVTATDDDDATSVIFGDGVHGARLPTGSSNVKATYRYGIGTPGNVRAGQISQLASQPLGLKGVLNPLPASGGADRDGPDDGRRNAPLAVAALDRLVSVPDYADFARAFAAVGKATAARLTDGRRQVVHVTIAGKDDIPIDPTSDIYRNLVQALFQNGDPALDIVVAVRTLKLLVLSARVKLLPDYLWEAVEPQLRDAITTVFGFDRRDLGQPAFLSEAIAALQSVPGVLYVDVQTFDSVAEGITAEQLASLASTLGRSDAVTADPAEVDPAQSDPDRRLRPAELAILTPQIPDTLILNPIP